MATLDVSTTIKRPVEDVFAVVSNGGRICRSIFVVSLITALAAPALAAAVTTVERSIDITAALSCEGERVDLTGSMVFVATFEPLQNDGFVFNFRTVTHGTGISSSGAVYRWSYNSQVVQILAPSGGVDRTYQDHFRLNGPTSTHSVRYTIHYTALPSGELLVEVFNISDDCR